MGFNGVPYAGWDSCYQNVQQRAMWKKAEVLLLHSHNSTGKFISCSSQSSLAIMKFRSITILVFESYITAQAHC